MYFHLAAVGIVMTNNDSEVLIIELLSANIWSILVVAVMSTFVDDVLCKCADP